VIRRTVPTGGYEYCLRTGMHNIYTVKFRAPKGFKVPEIVVDPDYAKFSAIITGKGEGQS